MSDFGEGSQAYQAVEQVKRAADNAIKDLGFISGSSLEQTSAAVWDRWVHLKSSFARIRYHADKYSLSVLDSVADEMASEIKNCDYQNVQFDDSATPAGIFGYCLKEYRDIIIDALKKELSQEARYQLDME